MEPPTTGQEAIGHDESPVQQLARVTAQAPGCPRAAGRDLRRPHRLASDGPAGAVRLSPAARPPHRRLTPPARSNSMTARADARFHGLCRDTATTLILLS